VQGDRDFHAFSDYILSFVMTYLYIENKFGKINEKKTEKRISGESDDEGVFVVLELFFWKPSLIQNFHLGICRELHGLSKYVIIFLKILFYDDDISKILCLTIFFHRDLIGM
jgi:hypothetical protein